MKRLFIILLFTSLSYLYGSNQAQPEKTTLTPEKVDNTDFKVKEQVREIEDLISKETILKDYKPHNPESTEIVNNLDCKQSNIHEEKTEIKSTPVIT